MYVRLSSLTSSRTGPVRLESLTYPPNTKTAPMTKNDSDELVLDTGTTLKTAKIRDGSTVEIRKDHVVRRVKAESA